MAASKSYIIRPYREEDSAGCIRCFKTNVPLVFTENEISEFQQWLDKLVTAPPDKELQYFVIAHNETIIGCGGIALEKTKLQVVFTWGLVHKDYQKKGYGKALAKFRLGLIEREYPNMDIVLDTSQHTYLFFEKLGFVTQSVTPDFYAKGLDRYDMRRPAMF